MNSERQPDRVASIAKPVQRQCGSCSLCCKVMGIHAIGKPEGEWCPHWKQGVGCVIYADRPAECADFGCYWYHGIIPEQFSPRRTRVVAYRHKEHGLYLVEDDHANALGEFAPLIKAWRDLGINVTVIRHGLPQGGTNG